MSREAGGWLRRCFRLVALVGLAACLGLAGAPAGAQDPEGQDGSSPGAPSAEGGGSGPDQGAVGEYRIGVEDQLLISVREDPALTGPVVVRPDGKIGVGLIAEDVVAAGKTTRQLELELIEGLSAFIESPSVRVSVVAVHSFKIYILGEVNSQGMIQVGSRIRFLQALALANGFTEFASKSNIILIRQQDGHESRRNVNYKKVESGEAENFYLRPGDTIIVK